jgi:hypothetical protein
MGNLFSIMTLLDGIKLRSGPHSTLYWLTIFILQTILQFQLSFMVLLQEKKEVLL